MKANAPKRKVFKDAVDLLTGGEDFEGGKRDIQMIPIESIRPFHDHPFHLYEGNRLEDMVESIREHGILCPVIVQRTEDGYEMLAGHNRQNAARIAGLKEIPAIIKECLTEREAYVYVIETNVIQRAFNDFSTSERIAILTERYDKVMSQGKRNDIIRELEELNGRSGTCGHDVHKLSRSREAIGEEYGLTGRHIARYIRCNSFIPEFKEMLDDGSLSLVAGVELSYLPEDEQAVVKKVMDQNGVRLKNAKAEEIRKAESRSEADLQKILGLGGAVKVKDTEKMVNVKLPACVYDRYFSNVEAKEVREILEQALRAWFSGKGAEAGVHAGSVGAA